LFVAIALGFGISSFFLHYQNSKRWEDQEKTNIVILRCIGLGLGLDKPSPNINKWGGTSEYSISRYSIEGYSDGITHPIGRVVDVREDTVTIVHRGKPGVPMINPNEVLAWDNEQGVYYWTTKEEICRKHFIPSEEVFEFAE